MSIRAAAIRSAITSVLTGALGTVRTMTSGVMAANVFEGQSPVAQHAKALQTDHVFDVRLVSVRNHESSPVAQIGSYAIKQAEIAINVVTATATVVQETERDTVLASIADDMNDACQALSFPANVEQTAQLEATGIVSGMLLGPGGDGSPEWAEVSQDWEKQEIRSRITCSALLRVVQYTVVDSEPRAIFGDSLRAWYRGDQYLDTVSTQLVSSWTDLSENSAALTPPVGPSSTLVIDLTTSLGQASAISVGASFNDFRVQGSASFLGLGDAPNVLIVGRFTQVDTGVISRIVDAVDASGNVVFRAIKSAADVIAYQVDATTVATLTAADTSAHLFEFLNDGTDSYVRTDDNGVTVGGSAPLYEVATRLGVPSTSSSNCAAFEYWEVVLLNSYPTAAQLTQYRQHVVDRYGLSITP